MVFWVGVLGEPLQFLVWIRTRMPNVFGSGSLSSPIKNVLSMWGEGLDEYIACANAFCEAAVHLSKNYWGNANKQEGPSFEQRNSNKQAWDRNIPSMPKMPFTNFTESLCRNINPLSLKIDKRETQIVFGGGGFAFDWLQIELA